MSAAAARRRAGRPEPAEGLAEPADRARARRLGPAAVDPAAAAAAAAADLDPSLERVLARLRLRARRRVAWLRRLWAEEGAPAGRGVIGHGEVDALLAGRDAPAAEAVFHATEPDLAEIDRRLAALEEAIAAETDTPLAELTRTFGLGAAERDLLEAALAAALEPGLGRLFAYLADGAGPAAVTEELVARLYGHGRGGLWEPDSPLARWRLVERRAGAGGESAILVLDPAVRDWLAGRRTLDAELVGIAELRPPRPPLDGWPVDAAAARLRRLLEEEGERVRVDVVGPPGSGRRTLAAAVAARLGLPLLAIDADAVDDADWPRVWLLAQRRAYLDRSALAFAGAALEHRRRPSSVPPFPLEFLILEPGQAAAAPGLADRSAAERIEVPPLSVEARRDLWRRLVPSAAAWDAAELDALAHRFRVTVGEVAAAAARAPASPAAAAEAVREAGRERFGRLAQPLPCPFRRADLVLPERLQQNLDDLVFEASERAAMWERPEVARLFPQGRGLLVLASGPPGTGKTMTAQVVAAELGLDLYRIDLAAVVSKYVGETSKNLERILARARHLDAVLLFDEADALFGRRTEVKDAHDRFANTDTDYLLQAIEDFPGLAFLSTNRKKDVDPAFLRRLRWVLDYPPPDAALRAELWRRLLGELAGADRLAAKEGGGRPLGERLEVLAATVEMTGAQIKYAVLAGLFAARRRGVPLGLAEVLTGVDRELAKEGRALSERQRQRLESDG